MKACWSTEKCDVLVTAIVFILSTVRLSWLSMTACFCCHCTAAAKSNSSRFHCAHVRPHVWYSSYAMFHIQHCESFCSEHRQSFGRSNIWSIQPYGGKLLRRGESRWSLCVTSDVENEQSFWTSWCIRRNEVGQRHLIQCRVCHSSQIKTFAFHKGHDLCGKLHLKALVCLSVCSNHGVVFGEPRVVSFLLIFLLLLWRPIWKAATVEQGLLVIFVHSLWHCRLRDKDSKLKLVHSVNTNFQLHLFQNVVAKVSRRHWVRRVLLVEKEHSASGARKTAEPLGRKLLHGTLAASPSLHVKNKILQ